jgi:hypothetical protein
VVAGRQLARVDRQQHPGRFGSEGGGEVTLQRTRARCEALAATIRVPNPFDLNTFVEQLGTDRGRPIYLLPLPLPPGAPCGVCLPTPATDYIIVTAAVNGPQRVHICLHEIAHLLLNHSVESTGSAASASLFPHLDPAVVRRTFARTTYTTPEEQEAEILASLLGQRAKLWRPPSQRASADPLVTRLSHSLEHSWHG